jgi:hypothetical protein
VRARRVAAIGLTAAVATLALAAAVVTASPTGSSVKCPIAVKGGVVAVDWAFSATVSPTYIHGRGSYTPGRASGTACQQRANANLVLSIQGRGTLMRGISKGGTTGAQLVLRVRVTARDLPSCPVGTRGKLTLFSSYNATQRDSVRLDLPACFHEALGGAGVHVAIPH